MVRIAYLGPAGTYSEAAMIAHNPDARAIPCASFSEAARQVETGNADEAVVAIENSLEGSVTDTLDLLLHESILSIKREVVIPIAHCLLAKPGTKLPEVEVVFSHTQALGQCRAFVEKRLGNAFKVASLSTVAAVADDVFDVHGRRCRPLLCRHTCGEDPGSKRKRDTLRGASI